MKELTIEEKAKAYDNVREKIAIRFGSNVADEIFSKYEDSEDERIRKALVRFHGSTIDIDGIKGSDIVAWLEKQSKQKPIWSEEDERLCSCLIRDQEKALDDVRNDKYGHSEIISDLKEMYRERIDWLKSLKDRVQPHWNPSDEQLDALHDAAVYVDKSMFPHPKGILMKLYKQLTKL